MTASSGNGKVIEILPQSNDDVCDRRKDSSGRVWVCFALLLQQVGMLAVALPLIISHPFSSTTCRYSISLSITSDAI